VNTLQDPCSDGTLYRGFCPGNRDIVCCVAQGARATADEEVDGAAAAMDEVNGDFFSDTDLALAGEQTMYSGQSGELTPAAAGAVVALTVILAIALIVIVVLLIRQQSSQKDNEVRP